MDISKIIWYACLFTFTKVWIIRSYIFRYDFYILLNAEYLYEILCVLCICSNKNLLVTSCIVILVLSFEKSMHDPNLFLLNVFCFWVDLCKGMSFILLNAPPDISLLFGCIQYLHLCRTFITFLLDTFQCMIQKSKLLKCFINRYTVYRSF